MQQWMSAIPNSDIRTEAALPGDVVALQFQPVETGSARCMAAATTRGLWWSFDDARTWSCREGEPDAGLIESILITSDCLDDQMLHAVSDGVLVVSHDFGRSWQPVLGGSRILAAICSDDRGAFFAGTEADGVLRSPDGVRWEGVNAGLLDFTVMSLAISPRFAADGAVLLGTPTGFYRSRNRGDAWRRLELGPIEPSIQAIALLADGPRDMTILAGTEADGLFVSHDGGRFWRQHGAEIGESVTALAAGIGGYAAAATESGIWVSSDFGLTWRFVERATDLLALSFLQSPGQTPSILFGPASGGIGRIEIG